MLIQICMATQFRIKQEQTYMYSSRNVMITTIIGAARNLVEIRTDRNSDPHEYRLGLHEGEITLKINRK